MNENKKAHPHINDELPPPPATSRLLEHKKPLYDRKHPNACSLSHRNYLLKLGIHFSRVEKSQQVTHFPRQQQRLVQSPPSDRRARRAMEVKQHVGENTEISHLLTSPSAVEGKT